MPIHEDYSDVLQNLEFSVVSVFRQNPEMTDYVAQRAYEAAYERYRAEQRGHPPKLHGLAGLDLVTYEAVCAICEFRLGRDPGPNPRGRRSIRFRRRKSLPASAGWCGRLI